MESRVRLIEELDFLERLSLIDVSYSRLDLISRCGARYFFTYCLQEERVFGAPATLGQMIHSVLEEVDWKEPLNLLELHQGLEAQRAVRDPEDQVPYDLLEAGHSMLSEFYDRHEGESFKVFETELPFALVVGRGLVSGYIDRVEETSHGLTVCDLKSGKWEVSQKDIPTNLQLGIYAVAVAKTYGVDEVYAELYYLRSGRRKGHQFTKENLEQIEEHLIQMISNLIDTTTFHYTDSAKECWICDFAKNGVCSIGAKRVHR